jgi:hypothetical protein
LSLAAVPGCVGAGRRGRSGRFMTWVVSAGQEPAGGGAPVDRAARPALLLPPGDPRLPAPQRCRLAPWDRWMLHRVISRSVVGVGAAHLQQLTARVADLAGRPCRAAWSATGPVMVVRPPGTARRASAPVPDTRGRCRGAVTAAVHWVPLGVGALVGGCCGATAAWRRRRGRVRPAGGARHAGDRVLTRSADRVAAWSAAGSSGGFAAQAGSVGDGWAPAPPWPGSPQCRPPTRRPAAAGRGTQTPPARWRGRAGGPGRRAGRRHERVGQVLVVREAVQQHDRRLLACVQMVRTARNDVLPIAGWARGVRCDSRSLIRCLPYRETSTAIRPRPARRQAGSFDQWFAWPDSASRTSHSHPR